MHNPVKVSLRLIERMILLSDTLFVYLLFVIGVILIIKGGDIFVDASSWIATVSGIPKFIIGATIVSVATTLPELLVSVFASIDGKVDMAVGNAVGSVTANIGLILATSIIFLPCNADRKNLFIKGGIMIVACSLLICLSIGGSLNFYSSFILLFLFALFIFENIKVAETDKTKVYADKKNVLLNVVKFIAGSLGIVIGANLLVDKGSIIAGMLGVSESIIGVTVIAVGTSLPELVTAITAIVKRESSLSIGNILGANIIDLTLILPLCSLVYGGSLPVNRQSILIDMPVCLLLSLISIIPALLLGKFKRTTGFILLAIYFIYICILCL